jgi:hypothetical protein
VKANLIVGTKKVISIAESMMNGGSDKSDGYGYNCFFDVQLTREAPCYGASAIGDGAYLHLDEHVNGLATMSRLGSYVPQTYILQIEDAAGKTLLQWKQPQGKQVIKADAAYVINDILSDPNASYLRSFKKFQHQSDGWKFAVKTGTTNDNYDGLMTSWSTKYAVATWVGYHTRNVAMTAGHMEDMTEPIVRGWMESAHKNIPAKNWNKPSGVKEAPAFVMTSSFGSGAVLPSPRTDVYVGGYNAKSGSSSSATIDKVSGKLATSCTPASAKQTLTNGNSNTFSIDQFVKGATASASVPTSSDDVHSCDDTEPTVQITLPTTGTCTGTCTFSVTPFEGSHPLSGGSYPGSLTVKVNGQTVGTYSVTNSGTPVVVQYQATGTGEVNVTADLTDSVLYSAHDSKTMPTI